MVGMDQFCHRNPAGAGGSRAQRAGAIPALLALLSSLLLWAQAMAPDGQPQPAWRAPAALTAPAVEPSAPAGRPGRASAWTRSDRPLFEPGGWGPDDRPVTVASPAMATPPGGAALQVPAGSARLPTLQAAGIGFRPRAPPPAH